MPVSFHLRKGWAFASGHSKRGSDRWHMGWASDLKHPNQEFDLRLVPSQAFSHHQLYTDSVSGCSTWVCPMRIGSHREEVRAGGSRAQSLLMAESFRLVWVPRVSNEVKKAGLVKPTLVVVASVSPQ